MIDALPCGPVVALSVLADTEAAAEAAAAEFRGTCPSATFGPVTLRVTGHFGCFGECPADEYALA